MNSEIPISKCIRVGKPSYHRHRSFNDKYRHKSTTKARFKRIIHVSTRPTHDILHINDKSSKRNNNKHSISNNSDTNGYKDQCINSSIVQNFPAQRINRRPLNVAGIEQYSHTIFQPNRKTCSDVNVNKRVTQISQNSQITNTSKMNETISELVRSGKNSSEVAPYHTISDNNWDTIKKKTVWFDNVDATNDNHRNAKEKKKKKCTKRYMIVFTVSALIIISILLIILLSVLLTRPKTTNTTDEPLLRWNRSGITITGIPGQPGNTFYQLSNPWDVALDWSNTLYVSDQSNNRVQKIPMSTSNGTTAAGYGNGTGSSTLYGLTGPLGIVVDESSNIYVADNVNHRVVLWKNGALSGLLFAGNGTSGNSTNQLSSPYGLARDSSSDAIYVTEYNNNRVMRFSSNNAVGTLVAGGKGNGLNNTQLSLPHAVHYDSLSNSILIVNTGGHNIVRWTLGASNWTLLAGSINGTSGSTSTLLWSPTDVTLHPMGNMYVVDRKNHRIQFFSAGQSDGTTIVGITGIHGYNATFLDTPSSLVLDNQLNLYVVDRVNSRLQKFLRY